MIKALQGELKKINRLRDLGAENYVMVTNAKSTGHLGAGRIDRVQEWMNSNLPIPATCLWAQDLDSRFDAAPASLKFKHAELLTGADGVQLVLEGLLSRDSARQARALKAFVAAQYLKDDQLKFKQVDLSNNLLDLFIDVPALIPPTSMEQLGKKPGSEAKEAIVSILAKEGYGNLHADDGLGAPAGYLAAAFDASEIGAAQFLLDPSIQDGIPLTVLRGAPGQGKSTLAQYVCQVHRARLLQKTGFLDRVPGNHSSTSFRLPFKVDLRDFSAYLEGKSPFATSEAVDQQPSLEKFLGELIQSGSGGLTFDVNDVVETLSSSPSLIFFDGLDEVANVNDRHDLVEAIGESLNRLRELGSDLQVVLTSRPTLFGKGPNFAKYGFASVELAQIELELVDEYAKKWIAARRLGDDERDSVRKILSEKLELPHIRELTRNPMQLTILLNLIHSVGHSLPDQRTDLYRRYVELFLTREADKTASVREHRHVLVGFVQHLAWTLQTQAESGRSNGSVSEADLRALVVEYLAAGSHSSDIIEEIFTGGVERIFVLVQRLEGLYEFEVQPLREYFCARHLYETAPVGTYRDSAPQGDRAQRFEAMAKNPFWTNVTRFYAGSYESGEIAGLVMSLKELILRGDLSTSLQARRVGRALLSDWVFSNKKFAQEELVRLIFDPIGVDLAASVFRDAGEGKLHRDCGQDIFKKLVLEHFLNAPRSLWTPRYARMLRQNGGRDLAADFVADLADRVAVDRTRVLVRMVMSGAANSLSGDEIGELLVADNPDQTALVTRVLALLEYEPQLLETNDELAVLAISHSLRGAPTRTVVRGSVLAIFAAALSLRLPPGYWAMMVEHLQMTDPAVVAPVANSNNELGTVRAFVAELVTWNDQARADTSRRRRHPASEDALADLLVRFFGKCWGAYAVALRASIQSPLKADNAKTEINLFDGTQPLVDRIRHARSRRSVGWWAKQLEASDGELDTQLWIAIQLIWPTEGRLEASREMLATALDQLSQEGYDTLVETVNMLSQQRRNTSRGQKNFARDWSKFSPRLAGLLLLVFDVEPVDTVLTAEQMDVPHVKYWRGRLAASRAIKPMPSSGVPKKQVVRWLDDLTSTASGEYGIDYETAEHITRQKIAVDVAEIIYGRGNRVLPELFEAGARSVEASFRAVPVSRIARQEKWKFS